MELIYNLSQKGYFSNKNLLINTAEAMDAFESDKAVVIMSDIWSLYQQLGDDFEKKYMPGSLVVTCFRLNIERFLFGRFII